MNQQQSVTFEMSADDQVAATKLSVLRVLKRPVRPLTVVGMAFGVLLVALTGVETIRTGQLSISSLIGFVPLAAFGFLLYFVTAPNAARRNYRHNKQLHHPITFS